MDRDKEVYCKSCAVCIYTEFGLYAVCAGPCRNSFHISCIGMSREQRKAISQGVVWICKECFPAFNDWRSDKPNTSPSTDSNAINSDDIAELKSQVSLIMDTLRLISSHSMSPSRTNIVHSTPKASDECHMQQLMRYGTGSSWAEYNRANDYRRTGVLVVTYKYR